MKSFKLKNLSYEVRILIIVILSILVPLVIFTSISIYKLSENITQVIQKELVNKSSLVAYSVDEFINERVSSAKILSQADILESKNISGITQYINEVVQADKWIKNINILSLSGELIASSEAVNGTYLSAIQSSLEIKKLLLLASKAQQNDVFVSNVHVVATDHIIQFITPITNDTNTILTAILVINVDIKHIVEIISLFNQGIAGNKYVYIIDNNGGIVITDNPAVKLHDTFPDLNMNAIFLDVLSTQGSSGSVIYTDYTNDEVMAAYADMSEFGVNKGLDWSIIAIASLEDITAPIEDMKLLFVFIGFIVALVSVFIAYILINKITIVLKSIASKAEQISQGNYLQDPLSQTDTNGAIGVLILAFNQMVLNIKEIIETLKERERYLEVTLNSISNAVITTDTDGIVTSMNPEAKQLTGFSSEEGIGLSLTKIFPILDPTTLEPIKNIAMNVILSAKELSHKESILINRHNVKYIIKDSVSPIQIDEDIIQGTVLVFNDITGIKNAENSLIEQKNILTHQAHYDALTELPNRVLFNDRLLKIIDNAKRNTTKFALFFIDLDNFKEINDSLGHDIGDEILKAVSLRLQQTIREEDSISRQGGDEFTIILQDLNEIQDASLIASKVLEKLSTPINIHNNILYVSCSIGISIFPDDGESSQDLLKFADSAMYKAKDEGKNNYQYYNSMMTEQAFERVVMETNLRDALKKEEQFIVYYQPQVDAATDKLVGMEALVRWEHPTMGLIFPDKFIPLAESTGLIVALDRLVMKKAMTQIAQWYKDGLNPGILAMNLAVKQLKQKDFIEIFQSLMIQTGCKAQWIELEVTEGQVMTNPEEAIKILQQISDIGIELAVDDFGTGYSSLAYLKRLPIDKLKIDRAFIKDLPDDEEDIGITRAVIALAKSLNLKVIAEGVETKEQKEFLVENGCINIQGYFYSKPIPANEFKQFLQKFPEMV